MSKIVVFVTAANLDEAEKIADSLIVKKLAACVSIVKGVKSFFWWEGKIDKADETLLIIKTKKALLGKVIKTVKSLHSYQVPEIIAMPISGGNKDYLKWIDDSTK